jgi:hypothetical protein
MEQQVEILKLEKDLNASRRRLGEMRRAGCVPLTNLGRFLSWRFVC